MRVAVILQISHIHVFVVMKDMLRNYIFSVRNEIDLFTLRLIFIQPQCE